MPTMTAQEQQAEFARLNKVCAAIECAADLRGGKMTDEEREQHGAAMAQIRIIRAEALPMPRRSQANVGGPIGEGNIGGGAIQAPRTQWRDTRTGEPLNTFAPNERFANRHRTVGDANDEPISIGRFLQAVGTGNWRNAEAERRVMAMGSNDSSGGHFLIPDPLSAEVIDLARASSVVFPWGAQSVELNADTLRIAKLTADPTFEVKAENAAFTGSNPTFGDIMLVPKLVGTVVTASRELAEDAPNFPQVIEQSLSKGLGAEVDRLILRGNGGSDGVQGIKSRDGIGSTGSIGGILWEDLHTAATAIRILNHDPNGYVVNPEIAGDLDVLTSGDGTNSAKLWLGAPPSLNGVQRLPTTGITNADILVGDGKKIVVGFRTQARVEVTTAADEAFEKHQIKWKITIRFDFGLTHAAAFHLLTGITT